MMKKYIVLFIGILLFIVSFVWMILSEESVGPFLILAAISGVVVEKGIYRLKH